MLRLLNAAWSRKRRIAGLLTWIVFAAIASAEYLPTCKLDEKFPVVKGRWVKTKERSTGNVGYDEADCPSYVHLTDCLRQSRDTPKTLAEYRYGIRC